MQLTLGQDVVATDGTFGELSAIVLDPHRGVVGHLIVSPFEEHRQPRLVPIWLTSLEDDVLSISLDLRHAHQLQRVLDTDFVKIDQPVDLDAGWDVGTVETFASPYWNDASGLPDPNDVARLSDHRIPKDHCEIRRRSKVHTRDGTAVGTVEGLVVDGVNLTGVVVEVGFWGLHHNRVVPIQNVANVETDSITLSLTRTAYWRLPGANGLTNPLNDVTEISPLLDRSHRVVGRAAALQQDIARRVHPRRWMRR